MPPRRRLGIRRSLRVAERCPAMSASASTASRTDGQTKPASSSPVATLAMPGSGTAGRLAVGGPVRAQALAPQQLGQPLGGPVALGHQHDPPLLRQPPAHVAQHPAGIAAVGLGGNCCHPERWPVATLVRLAGLAQVTARRPGPRPPRSRTA